jgi:hypothetical protein
MSLKISTLLLLVFPLLTVAQKKGEVLYNSETVRFHGNKITVENLVEILIPNKESNHLGSFSLPYSKHDKLKIVEAAIYDQAGTRIRKLKSSEIFDHSMFSQVAFYNDMMVKSFRLTHDKYPYVVRVNYTTTTKQYTSLAFWIPYHDVSVATKEAILTLIVPNGTELGIKTSGKFTYKKIEQPKTTEHRWQISNLEALESELLIPETLAFAPYVIVNPKEFHYGINGSLESWKSLGEWITKLNDNSEELTEKEKRVVDRLLEGVADNREKIRILYHYLQDNTRYVNVMLGVGGLKTHPATYVCENKYGDCKALSNYMKSLLKYAGIKAHYTIIQSNEKIRPVDKDFAYQGAFNHVITCIPMETDTIWLENTAKSFPFNYIGTSNQNRMVLVADGASSHLIKTPALSIADVQNATTYSFNLKKDGSGQVQIISNLRGDEFENLRGSMLYLNQKEQKDQIQKQIPMLNAELKTWSVDSFNRDQKDITLRIEAELKNQVRDLAGTLLIKPFTPVRNRFESPDKRKLPVHIPYPVNNTDTLKYSLKNFPGYSVKLADNVNIESKFGHFRENWSITDNKVVLSQSFLLNAMDIPLSEYAEFYAFFEEIKNIEIKRGFALIPQ